MKNSKNITIGVPNKFTTKFIEYMNNICEEGVDCFEGNLLDNYVFYLPENYKFNFMNAKLKRSFKYLIVEELVETGWSSQFGITFTNDIDLVEEFIEKYRVYEED